MNKKYTPETSKEAARLHLTGLSTQQVADKMGISRTTIYKWIVKQGVLIRRPSANRYSPEFKAAAVQFYRDNLSTRDVAKKTGVGSRTVATWVSLAGATRSRSCSARHGEDAWNWKGGVTKRSKHPDNAEYRLWRATVFARDRWTCQNCGDVGGKLNAHHILAWAKYVSERYNPNNGITLCEPCHKQVRKRKKKIA